MTNAMDSETLERMADELRLLCADMVEEAKSGHPGAPMGLADIVITLAAHLKINPKDPTWINRDRLVFSGGHASALLYAFLHLFGFDLKLEDLRTFRKIHSKTPGHPERGLTPGVEVTTGPLAQGIGAAVGLALAAKKAARLLGEDLINHKIYCLCGDGDIQEGLSYEACSLAGRHKLDNLVLIYDSNDISIEGEVSIAFNEEVSTRFKAQGFCVLEIDGHDCLAIDSALKSLDSKRPTLIIAKTKIARKAYNLEGSHSAHGAPLGQDVIAKTKQLLGLPKESFFISEELKSYFGSLAKANEKLYEEWQKSLKATGKAKLLESLSKKEFEDIVYPDFGKSDSETTRLNYKSAIATRSSNGLILNALAKSNSGFVGGSADLAPSTNTLITESKDFPEGVNFHFGIREHAMAAICNGLAAYGIFMPYCATFFVFSDYLAPSLRLASLMKLKIFYIFTHDSIGVGEDGATHQPIEQLSHLRAMPNLLNWRVADANENLYAWQNALELDCPQTFILTRQKLPVIESKTITKDALRRGGYVISFSSLDSKNPRLSLLASGSEVPIAIKAQMLLENLKELLDSFEGVASEDRHREAMGLIDGLRLGDSKGLATQVISMPCYELFSAQDEAYMLSVFKDSRVLGIEALRSLELYKFCEKLVCMEDFGASGLGELLFEEYGFSPENIAIEGLRLVAK